MSFSLCVGGRNFPAELVPKIFLSPCRIHLKNCPSPEDEGYSVVSLIGYAVSFLNIAGAWGRCKPPTGPGQSPGGSLSDEAPKRMKILYFTVTKQQPKKH